MGCVSARATDNPGLAALLDQNQAHGVTLVSDCVKIIRQVQSGNAKVSAVEDIREVKAMFQDEG